MPEFDRPQYHILPADEPLQAINILRAAAGLDQLGDDDIEPTEAMTQDRFTDGT